MGASDETPKDYASARSASGAKLIKDAEVSNRAYPHDEFPIVPNTADKTAQPSAASTLVAALEPGAKADPINKAIAKGIAP